MEYYEYYKYGGMMSWVANYITDICMPLSYYVLFYLLLPRDCPIIVPMIAAIFPLIESLRATMSFFRKLPGMVTAKKIFNERVGIPDNLIRCTHWRNVAIKLADSKILESEKDFCVSPGSIDSAIIDLFLENSIPDDITTVGIELLKAIVHRTMRNNCSVRISIFIQLTIEVITWPYSLFSRIMNVVTKTLPEVYSDPSILFTKVFRPSLHYRYRGYYELEFDTKIRMAAINKVLNDFLSEFPSPGIDVLFLVAKNIAGVSLVVFIWYWNTKAVILLVTVLAVLNRRNYVSGNYYPHKTYNDIADRFSLDRDNPIKGRDFCMKESSLFIKVLLDEIFGAVLVPVYCLLLLRYSIDIQSVVTKRLIPINGVPGIICSTRVYKHVAFIESNEYYFGGDNWIYRSTQDLEREYSSLLKRACEA